MQTQLHPLGSQIADLYMSGLSQTNIGKQLSISSTRVRKIMHLCDIPIRTNREQAIRYRCDEHYFDAIDTEEKAYWLGFMYADGYIQSARKHSSKKVGVALMESDHAHLEKLKQALLYTGPVCHYNTGKHGFAQDTPYCRLLISSPVLADALISKGCFEHKTGKLTFPTDNIVPHHLLLPFVRGYFDGNGSITHHSPKPTCTVGLWTVDFVASKELLDGIAQFLGVSHLKYGQRHPGADQNTYSIRIGGNKRSFAILDRMYDGSAIHLDRKFQRYLDSKQEYLSQLSRAKQ